MNTAKRKIRWGAGAACLAAVLPILAGGCRGDAPAAAPAGPSRAPMVATTGPAELGRYELDVLRAINATRRSHGLAPLVPVGDLVGMARRQAMDMVHLGRVTHEGRDGSLLADRAREAGVRYRAIGENVAANRGYRDPPAETVRGWMASAAHKATILHDAYREIGVAAVRCPKTGTWYFAAVFCGRAED